MAIFSNYQRRACIIVDGITPVKDETEEHITAKTKNFLIKNLGFEERKVNEELDKCHHLGKAKDGKQLSLTKCRTKIINYAHRTTESVPEAKFAYADVNGNLKIHLHEQKEGKYTFPFHSIDSSYITFLENLASLYQTMMYLMTKMFKEVVRNTFLFVYNIIFSFLFIDL